jgi:hypothetical protein
MSLVRSDAPDDSRADLDDLVGALAGEAFCVFTAEVMDMDLQVMELRLFSIHARQHMQEREKAGGQEHADEEPGISGEWGHNRQIDDPGSVLETDAPVTIFFRT